MSTTLWAVISVAVVSALSALGYFILGRQRNPEINRSLIFFMVSLAVGVLFGDVFFHLVPELFSDLPSRGLAPWFILLGFLTFFVLEKFLRWRHCHLPEASHYHPVVAMTLLGDAAHNFTDGLIIGAAYALNFKIGLTTSIAVFCHELPAELGRYGVLVKGGMSPGKALAFNGLSAVTSFFGLFVALAAIQISPSVSGAIGAATAGGFVYIAGSDLVPELHHELSLRRSAVQLGAIVLGLAVMAFLKTCFG
jgi:zinc and cadmium transporter